MDWSLYDGDLRHENVKQSSKNFTLKKDMSLIFGASKQRFIFEQTSLKINHVLVLTIKHLHQNIFFFLFNNFVQFFLSCLFLAYNISCFLHSRLERWILKSVLVSIT